jgi:signal transduction histidine kinase
VSSTQQSAAAAKAFAPLNFRVSTGLKDIIGRDLITDDFVAVFELVKNSFDAGAKRVDVVFLDDSILVIDNGKGMTQADIKEKWLFVAYSAKRDGTEDADYRHKIDRQYAGSKGIGRFSCDRLGMELKMFSRARGESRVQMLDVNWSQFEVNPKDEFYDIPVKLRQLGSFDLEVEKNTWTEDVLPGLIPRKSGTVLQIAGLREAWNRDKLLDLHAHLSKLISPFQQASSFKITVHSFRELEKDERLRRRFERLRENGLDLDGAAEPKVVNGLVQNFVFSTLESRATYLEVAVTPDGRSIESTLHDRGKLVYKIREPNLFPKLKHSHFACSLFYLNQASKNVFKRRMGVSSVKFGSIFLFRNGFRVYPIGDEGRDDFGIDRRKQQGYRRYLGTRDIIGRIDVQGIPDDFREASSRDHGLIRTPAYMQLVECFYELCLKRLERYVTGVNWSDALDKENLDPSRLQTPQMRLRIIEVLAGFAANHEVQILDFGKDVFDILSARVEEAGLSIEKLRLIADRLGDKELQKQVEKANRRIKFLSTAEQQARERAEQERQARESAEAQARTEASARLHAEAAYSEERKRNLFLMSQVGLDKDVLVDLHHQITIYATNLRSLVDEELRHLTSKKMDAEHLQRALGDIALCADQILAASKLATRANFRVESEEIEDDLAVFFAEYSSRVCSLYQNRVQIEVDRATEVEFRRKFKPIDVSIIIDNLVQNAHRAHASLVKISVSVVKSILEVKVSDDGFGLDKSIKEPDRIFERGFTTTAGSGLGLYHVKSIVEGMDGSISLQEPELGGSTFLIRIAR